jgi:subtilisin family serine protease
MEVTMAKRKVIVELKYNRDLAEVAFSAAPTAEKNLDTSTAPKIPGVNFDESFAPVNLPGMTARTAMNVPYVSGAKFDLELDAKDSTYIVRAEVDEDKIAEISGNKSVVGVYADVEIQPTIICPGSPPMGTDADVERLLCVPQMHGIGMDGLGVLIAIVDTGFNLSYLAAHGKVITLDPGRSWVPSAGMIPGDAPVSHGTMCAFDAAIAAPKATFLDIQVLRSSATGPTPMSGVLSDAIRAYSYLCNIMTTPRRPGEHRSMVVSNSWGMFHPSWDFPIGDPGNYSDNPNHPFNRIVGVLESVGADILFAAGNCGSNCPDGRCQGVTANAIYGANGHPAVLTIAGVDISKTRVGYSTQGPGRLSQNKPDLCGYTHFRGSGVYTADGGTSAATPVVAGVVAAVRTKSPYEPGNPATTPAAVRALMRSTAEDLGAAGFDFDHGFGVVGGCALYKRFRPFEPFDICKRYPWLCKPPIDICKRYPQLCKGIPRLPIPPGPGPIGSTAEFGNGWDMSALEDQYLEELLRALYQAGYIDGQKATGGEGANPTGSGDCDCGADK